MVPYMLSETTLDRQLYPLPSPKLVLLCACILALAAVVAYALPLYVFFNGLRQDELWPVVTDRDFANYWMAGRMVLSGEHPDLLAQDTYMARLYETFGSGYPFHNWSYPPHFLLLLWPLGFLEYKTALLTFLALTFFIFVASVITFRKVYAPASGGFVLACALLGYVLVVAEAAQNGFLTAAAMLFGLALMKRSPALAGLAFAVLTIKPQLGFLIPVLLVFDRNWRTLAWGSAFTGLLVTLSISFFGLESWAAYFSVTVPYQRSVMMEGHGTFLTMMPTLFGSLRVWGVASDLALKLQAVVSLVGVVIVGWILLKQEDPLTRIFSIVCGTFLITPYAFNYDMGALAAVAVLLACSRDFAGPSTRLLATVTAMLPAAVISLGRQFVPVTPMVLAACLSVVVLESFRTLGKTRQMQPDCAP